MLLLLLFLVGVTTVAMGGGCREEPQKRMDERDLTAVVYNIIFDPFFAERFAERYVISERDFRMC